MAKNAKESLSLEKLAGIPPVLPIISDHPLDTESAGRDKFDLCYRLGPIFDIIRHPKTATPTTIAIYGDWGVGKTSAMKWLEALIKEWNEQPDGPDKTTVHPVWFYPWKYHDKEDVWRGLISEVILASINVKGADLPRIEKAAKQFGSFLGRSFLHALSAIDEKAASAIQETIEEFNRVNHPEKAYLNVFEKELENWVKDTMKGNNRMVIFVDDLDRCMPEIALQVLEALKLYLNIKKLIFVVGVDNNVIEPLVKSHYKELGLDETIKSDKYLSKMFQTEVTVGPSEKQVTDYLDKQLDEVEYFKVEKGYLTKGEKTLFKELINKFADRNPREVKRLINNAVMVGAGAEMLKKAGRKKPALSFKQGLQVFFIRKIVENPKTYNMLRLVGSNLGNDFFAKWSKITCENKKKNPDFPLNILLPEDYFQQLEQAIEESNKEGSLGEVSEKMMRLAKLEKPPNVPGHYYGLIQDRRFRNLLRLLADEDIGRLMQIKFSSEIAEITQKVERRMSDIDIIRQAIADGLNKEINELLPDEIFGTKELDLSNRGIRDINEFKYLTNLTELQLGQNQIVDIRPLKNLTNLTALSLWGNRISDIRSLKGLKNLRELYLWGNQIGDISVIKYLGNIEYLGLGENPFNDLSPLYGLAKLKKLNIRYSTNISDKQISELQKALPNLKIER
ncbi:MAG: P-loop NTPase fold protein [Sedimentisphaerales bacterium]